MDIVLWGYKVGWMGWGGIGYLRVRYAYEPIRVGVRYALNEGTPVQSELVKRLGHSCTTFSVFLSNYGLYVQCSCTVYGLYVHVLYTPQRLVIALRC